VMCVRVMVVLVLLCNCSWWCSWLGLMVLFCFLIVRVLMLWLCKVVCSVLRWKVMIFLMVYECMRGEDIGWLVVR